MEAHGTARVISTFAWQHLKAATTFRDRVIAIEAEHAGHPLGAFFEDLRSYASGCVMSATASLEALINELFIFPHCGLRTMFTDFEAEFWGKGGVERKPILEKYQLALKMLGKPTFQRGSSPYQDAWALIELRNALVHFKPLWDPERERAVELVEVLDGKYATSPFVDDGADFVTVKSMSAGNARWVVQTALSFISEFDARTQLDEKKMGAFRSLGESPQG